MDTSHPAVVAQIIGFGVFVWLGLYLLVRAPLRRPLIRVSLVGLFAQAAFFAAGALTDTARDPALLALLERIFWWATVLPAAAWLHFSALVARGGQGQRPGPAPAAAYLAAALLVGLGTLSDALVDYGSASLGPGGAMLLRPGPLYGVYVAYLALTGLGALANFALVARRASGTGAGDRALRQAIRLLTTGALLFLAGALALAAQWAWGLALTALLGYIALLTGAAALGFGIVTSGLLLEGQHAGRDVLYSLTGLSLLNLAYVLLLTIAGVGDTPALLALVALVTATHMTLDQARTLLDRLFFSPAEQEARSEARDYAALLSTMPVSPPDRSLVDEPPADELPADEAAKHGRDEPPSQKAFRAEVRRALTGLKSPPRLAQSGLLTLRLVSERLAREGLEDNRLNRAAALRELLVEAIEGLRPEAGAAGHHVGEAWRFYNVLHYPYVREMSRKGALAEARRLEQERRREGRLEPGELELVLAWLADVDEDTYYKWQRRASDTIAAALWDAEVSREG